MAAESFSTDCRLCPRLAGFLDDARQQYPHYYCRPVPSFGPPSPCLLIVGLAPGLHGANATGRPFTGDFAGRLLYATLHKFEFASRAESITATDGLELLSCRITNAVRCVPPGNKPTSAEVQTCNAYLAREISDLSQGSVILALGTIAHGAVLRALGLKQASHKFRHGRSHELLSGFTLFDSYHCSRYNTQTRRLTAEMFGQVFESIRQLLEHR